MSLPTDPIPPFAPGDLVTAAQLNRLVDAINALNARVAALERRRPRSGAAVS